MSASTSNAVFCERTLAHLPCSPNHENHTTSISSQACATKTGKLGFAFVFVPYVTWCGTDIECERNTFTTIAVPDPCNTTISRRFMRSLETKNVMTSVQRARRCSPVRQRDVLLVAGWVSVCIKIAPSSSLHAGAFFRSTLFRLRCLAVHFSRAQLTHSSQHRQSILQQAPSKKSHLILEV
jgi:hypothetical protein